MYYVKRIDMSSKMLKFFLIFIILIYFGLHLLLQKDIIELGFHFIILLVFISLTKVIHKKVLNERNYFRSIILLLMISNFVLTLFNLMLYIIYLIMLHNKNDKFDMQKSWEAHSKGDR
jgi:predicted membrane protein